MKLGTKLASGMAILAIGCLISVSGLGGFAVSFVINMGGTSSGSYGPLTFVANNFRAVCASELLIGLFMALTGWILIRSARAKMKQPPPLPTRE